MQKHVPGSYVRTVSPSATAVGVGKPTPMMAYDYILVAGAHVSDELAYKIAKTIAESAAELPKLHPTLADFTRSGMAPKLDGLEYHPGAMRYFKEVGLWPAK